MELPKHFLDSHLATCFPENVKVILLCFFIRQIEDGEIFASINQKDGMVSFDDNPETYNNVAMLVQLDQEVQDAPLASHLRRKK